MSADNYVVVRKFGENNYGWAMFFASEDSPDFSEDSFRSDRRGFKTPQEAAQNANKELLIIEYGIRFEDDCFSTAVDLSSYTKEELEEELRKREEAEKLKSPEERLRLIAKIIEDVDLRCMAVDGPVTPTLEEMTQDEISSIYSLARGF